MTGVELRVLGAVEAVVDGRRVALGGPKPRAVVALLALAGGRPVHTDTCVDALWGGSPPATAVKTLQKYVSLVRGHLEYADQIVTAADGYALGVAPDRVDVTRFERLVDAADEADPATRAASLRRALGLWRGEPFAELGSWPAAVAERARLAERRLGAVEELAAAQVATGAHARVVGWLEELVATHPLRERLWELLMLALYRARRQGAALDAYQRLRTTLADELGIDPSPPLQRLHERVLRQDPDLDRPAAAPPPRHHIPASTAPPGPDARRTNLPRRLTSFVGRHTEAAELGRLLSEGRLVTVTGAAGCGKTRLALELAERVADRYPDGVWLVGLVGSTRPEEVAATVLATFRLADQPDRTRTEVLVDYLAGKRLLVVVDNCEHVIDGAAGLLADLLRATDDLTVLATSREPLAVPGETTYELHPLPVPEEDATDVGGSDAVRLLVDRARAADPRFELDHTTAGAVVRICRRLDGLPLALELAAARLRAFGVEELAGALGDRFSVLRAGDRTAPPRHHTLLGAVDWSHDLLTSAEQVLFRRLSVFRGSFDLEMVTAVCATDPIARSDVLALLPALVDRSLVVADRRPHGGTRYRLLETLREYAALQLDASDDATAVRERCAQRIASMTTRAAVELHGPRTGAWLDRLDDELGNVRAILEWSIDGGRPGPALRVAADLWFYWEARGRLSEGRAWLARALELEPDGASAPALRRRAVIVAGMLASSQGDPDAADAFAREGLELSERVGDEAAIADALHVLAQVAQHRGDYQRAEDLLRDCIDRYRRLGSGWEVGWALHHLGNVARLQGDYARARVAHEEGLAVYREVGDQLEPAYALWMIGVSALHQGDHDVARARWTEALAILERFDDRAGVAHVRSTMGDLARIEGDTALATRLYEDSLARLRELGDRRCVASVLRNLGILALADEPVDGAIRLLVESLALRRRLGDKAGVGECLEGLARAVAVTGAHRRAVRLCAAAQRLRDVTGASRSPLEQQDHDAWVESVERELGTEAFASEWRRGQEPHWEAVVTEAVPLGVAVQEESPRIRTS